ncbi:helix-turn-helix domain-containing protein [Algoriphagus terrigena]|uniref:helix-turn-helix domain-containing protein n=1 Tax=Algoriphagus terrigena TaxID=344884 RepID=UPI0004062DE9|nr:helix-turn-helix domain-containing protein [Algoriphagus terrigena]
MASYQIHQPHPALKHYVRYYWTLDVQLNEESMLNLQVMADRYPRIVIQCLEGKNALYSPDYEAVYAASLKGIATKPVLVRMESTYSHIAASLFPHSIQALFGIDGHETADAVLDLHHFCDPYTIEQIMEARHTHVRLALLEAYLLRRLNVIRTVDWRVVNFSKLSTNTHYGHLLKSYSISERQFERKFLQSIGFTPSYYKRVLRFEKALFRIQQKCYKSLADLAYELGYADQSHFNREFKQFSAMTPLTLLAQNELVKESGSLLIG